MPFGCRAGRHLTGTASPATLMPTYSRVRAGTSANVAESQSQHRRSVAVADPQPTRSHERAIKNSPRVPRAERLVRVRPESAGGVVSGALAGGDSGSPIGGALLDDGEDPGGDRDPPGSRHGAEQSAPDEHAEDREEPQRGLATFPMIVGCGTRRARFSQIGRCKPGTPVVALGAAAT
jgi:hypothetical protein